VIGGGDNATIRTVFPRRGHWDLAMLPYWWRDAHVHRGMAQEAEGFCRRRVSSVIRVEAQLLFDTLFIEVCANECADSRLMSGQGLAIPMSA
jgi:hypothetical protein